MIKLVERIKKHPVIAALILVAIFFAPIIIVQALFQYDTGIPFFQAKWSAGDALSYIVGYFTILSTAILSGLAVWQNERFKQENDVAQDRLEKLTRQANEQVIINKIIEIESSNLLKLEESVGRFCNVASPQSIASSMEESLYLTEIDSSNMNLANTMAQRKLAKLDSELDTALYELSRCLVSDTRLVKDDQNPLKKAMGNFYMSSKKVIDCYISNKDKVSMQKSMKVLQAAEEAFVGEREKYLRERHGMLNKAIYGHLSLDEIKKMYYEEEN